MASGMNLTNPVDCGPASSACFLHIDSFSLPGARSAPIVVMIPGGPLQIGNRDYLWTLARWVAARGAVVFTADYRSGPLYGGGFPATFADVACAIRFARQRGAELGGDPSRVTLVAHSYGGFPAAVVALSRRDFAVDEPDCVTPSGDGHPQALVGIAGIYALDSMGQDFLAGFFGGDRTTEVARWAAADVTLLPGLKGHPTPTIRLLAGTADATAPSSRADAILAALQAAGFDVTRTVLDGVTHDSILDQPATVDAIQAAIAAP
jgi:acetyl esterase